MLLSGNRIDSERLPTGVLINTDFIFSEIILSLIHPRSPPLIPDSERLNSLATFSNPSF